MFKNIHFILDSAAGETLVLAVARERIPRLKLVMTSHVPNGPNGTAGQHVALLVEAVEPGLDQKAVMIQIVSVNF